MKPTSILILGATGRLGMQLLTTSTQFHPHPQVHAYTPDPSRFSDEQESLCYSVQKGELTSASDLSAALRATAASVVILAIDPDRGVTAPAPTSTKGKSGGSCISSSADTRRLDAARALMDALASLNPSSAASAALSTKSAGPDTKTAQWPSRTTQHRPRIIVMSALGAGGTTLRFTLGFGKLMATVRRSELEDHDAAEREVRARLGTDAAHRLLIVRPTRLVDAPGTGKVRVFQHGRVAAPFIARKDVAGWVMQQACSGQRSFGREVCICRIAGRREKQWAIALNPKSIELEN